MYRQLTQPNSPVSLQIYCVRGEKCNLHCGKFHRRKLRSAHAPRASMDPIEAAAREANALVEARRILQLQQEGENEENDRPKFTLVTSSPEREPSITGAADDEDPLNNPLALALKLAAPPSPAVSHTSSMASQMSSLGTCVTLDDIIASARRKISEDYSEIRLPTPVLLDEDPTLWDRRAAKKRLLFPECSLDVPACGDGENGNGGGNGGEAGTDMSKYEDMYSEAELQIQEQPPQFMHDEETEDFEEMIKAAKPPTDAFSNPILLRDADPLTTRKKTRRARAQAANLLRQQSMTRLHKLGEMVVVSGPPDASRTSSNTASAAEDFEDNSSIDIPLTELSAIVAKSTSHSGATSPANILQFIEDQKQRAASRNVVEQPQRQGREVGQIQDEIAEQPGEEEVVSPGPVAKEQGYQLPG